MKELKWRDNMSVEEKLEAGFKAVLGQLDAQRQEINGLRQFMGKKLIEVGERFDKTDARTELQFKQMESAVRMLRSEIFDVKMNTRTLLEDMTIVKMDVKDLHERLDGLASTVDRHDSIVGELHKAVGQK